MANWSDRNAETMANNAAIRNYEPQRQAFLAKQASDRQAQNNFMLENGQQQNQQNFVNQGVLRTRSLEDTARDSANMGDLTAIKYLQSLEKDSGQGGSTPTFGSGSNSSGFSSGASPAFAPGQSAGPQPQMTLDRLAQSVIKQNPSLAGNPSALFTALDRLKPMLIPDEQQKLAQLKFQQDKELQTQKDAAALERVKARPASGGGSSWKIEKIAYDNTYAQAIADGETPEDAADMAMDAAKAAKRANPEEVGAAARAKQAAKGEISPQEQVEKGQNQMETIIDDLNNNYDKLDQMGGAVSTKYSPMANVGAFMANTSGGQLVGGMLGTEAQSIRDQISQSRPILINAIRKATGMGAKAMDSNAELQFYLSAATDPTKGIQANRAALKRLSDTYDAPGADKPASASSANQPPMQGARKAPDGNWYVQDPKRPGKYLKVQ